MSKCSVKTGYHDSENSWINISTTLNLCAKGHRRIYKVKTKQATFIMFKLPDRDKLVGTMFCPVSPQVNSISKVVAFRCKFLQNLLECTLAHFPPSNPGPTAFGAHWERIH